MTYFAEVKKVGFIGLGLFSLALAVFANPEQKQSKPEPPKKPQAQLVDFNRQIRPLLSQHCWPCHGNDKAKNAQTGGLRLDSFEAATAEHNNHFPIVPGDPSKSWILKRAGATNPDLRMPPSDAHEQPFTAEELALVTKWIAQGAKYEKHWAFVPPVKAPLPDVKHPEWCRNEIDRFVLAGLEAKGLAPEPEATPEYLVRRAALLLTGLPPTQAEEDRYLKYLGDTKESRDKAYEAMVDYFMAKPQYGEHQGRYWLDAVRYADTHGLHIDNRRDIFPYRDWVVRAFNQNLPYDKFLEWQLAGDLLPNPTLDQEIATGYVRMNPTTNEGGAIAEEFQVKNTVDRVDTTSTVMLGVTMACSRCHDHKYDPFTQEEYYKLFAYFNSTAEAPLDGNLNAPPPAIKAPNPEQRRIMTIFNKRMENLEAKVDEKTAKDWLLDVAARIPRFEKWQQSPVYTEKDFETAVKAEFAPEKPDAKIEWKDTTLGDGVRLDNTIGKDNSATYFRSVIDAPRDTKYTVKMGTDDGVKVWVNGKLVHDNPVLRGATPDQDTVTFDLKKGKNVMLVKVINGPAGDTMQISYGDDASRLVSKGMDKNGNLSPETIAKAKGLYLLLQADNDTAKAYKVEYKKNQDFLNTVPLTLVAQEMNPPRKAYILKRGEYDHREKEVTRGTPHILNPLPKSAPSNRLGLAEWMVSDQNPLVSRVYVNRIWQQYFGTGIVETSEDFGSQGAWPSNPELLDWIAVDFREHGWDNKRLVKQIVMSAAFRQSSAVTKAKYDADPGNRLISRGPRFRLDAEVVRDQALAVSGLLNTQIGGPGDRPYQPPGLWEALGFMISDTSRYVQDHRDSLYRRSLYLFWKRTSPPPTMQIFDAPDREACTVRRSRTNTPTQALVTLNEPGFVEASRIMAEKVMREPGTDEDKVAYAFRLVTCRDPKPNEQKIISDFFQTQKSRFAASPADAVQLLSVGEKPRDKSLDPSELAAWSMVCNMVLNLDEALTVH